MFKRVSHINQEASINLMTMVQRNIRKNSTRLGSFLNMFKILKKASDMNIQLRQNDWFDKVIRNHDLLVFFLSIGVNRERRRISDKTMRQQEQFSGNSKQLSMWNMVRKQLHLRRHVAIEPKSKFELDDTCENVRNITIVDCYFRVV